MMALELYLPVPTISREVNDFPAITSGSGFMVGSRWDCLTAADEVNDLDFIIGVHDGRIVSRPLNDRKIVLNGDLAGIYVEPCE